MWCSVGLIAGVAIGFAACGGPAPLAAPAAQPPAAGDFDRTVLPIAEPNYPHATELDARKATAPPRFAVKAPRGA
ncbi:MAG TPA: hypothetical protein VNG89_28500, partial [Vicinamibacterales bacterium]|nr:hypothetical protein [Vicinamibacterales bacterium]